MSDTDSENAYLTTREVAELLRLKERKVYDLAANGRIPCSRATGKLLFPRHAIEAWINGETATGAAVSRPRPAVLLGSYEPLLEWAVRESGCGLALLLDGSIDGLQRFLRGEGVAAGMHIYDAPSQGWNTGMVGEQLQQAPVALIEFTWRERGLILPAGGESQCPDVAALRGRRVVQRQAGAGSQVLLSELLARAQVGDADVNWVGVARTESDAALAVLDGRADAALGLRAVAEQLHLGFVPLVRERYDLLVDHGAWFEAPLQTLMAFCRSTAFAEQAGTFAGYDISGLGRVRFNGRG